MANLIDKAIAYLSPVAAIKRAHARRVLAYYEAAKPDRLRKGRRETGSGNDAILRAGSSLRQQARHLDQNYDLAKGVLNTLVANVVGANGIGVEPQPRRADGSIHIEFARELLDIWKDLSRKPEVTWMHDRPSMERLLARTWFRDGEVFAQTVEGIAPWIDHGTRVPLSIEMMEPDYVPMDMQSVTPPIQQGIEINAWGRPIGYHVYKANPLESGPISGRGQTKRIGADRMLHLATRERIRQLRGVSVFASVLNRFDDLKDYEESERIAAKVAASMAAFIKKGNPDLYEPQVDASGQPISNMRQMKFRPGMIFDDLRPGEEIGTIDTNRPNPNLEIYRNSQIKAIAAGTGPTYSSASRTYDGTYSAQRQELVEGWMAYQILSAEFISRITRPFYEKFVALAILSGAVRKPADVVIDSIDDAIYIPPQMPWIDPLKEVEAWAKQEDRAYISGPEIIRKRGGNPLDVLEQQARWLEEKKNRDIPIDAGKPAPAVPPAPTEKDDAIATLMLAQARATLAEKPPAAPPVINNTINMPEQPAPVVNVGGATINLPELQPTFEATVESPTVTVENHVQAGDVNVTTPAQPAPIVKNEITVEPAHISQIEIVGMPDRVTTTEVVRDKRDNITTTTQTEKDA
jgi:lambda family phage portal protein